MSNNIRPEYPAMPSNPPASQGAVGNVGSGPDPAVIRPEHPAKPANPASGQGSVGNVGGGTEKPVVRSNW